MAGGRAARPALQGSPFQRAAASALQKLLAVMPEPSVRDHRLADQVIMVRRDEPPRPVPRLVEEAVAERRVLHLDYLDRDGERTRRTVEPVGFVGNGQRWYLLGWCRLRDGVRAFRLDGIQRAVTTDEVTPSREITAADCDIPAHLVSGLPLGSGESPGNTDRTVSPGRATLVSSDA